MTKQRCVRIFHFLWGRSGVTVYAVLVMYACIFGCLPALAAAEKRVQCGSYTFIVPEGFEVLYKKRDTILPWKGREGWCMELISPTDDPNERPINTIWCITAINSGNKPFATRRQNEMFFADVIANDPETGRIISVPLVDAARNDVRIYHIEDYSSAKAYHLGDYNRFVLELPAKDRPEHVFIHAWAGGDKYYGYGMANALLASIKDAPVKPQKKKTATSAKKEKR